MSAPSTTTMTAEQLFLLPDDGMRYELIAGELRMMSPAGSEHGAVVFNLTGLFALYLNQHRLGQAFGAETGFLVKKNPDTVRAPDIGFVAQERMGRIGLPQSYFPEAPDLAVEVISPSDLMDEVEEKVRVWLKAGCLEVWLVSPRLRTVTLYHTLTDIEVFAGDQTVDRSRVLPDLRCPLNQIFGGI